MDKKLMMSKKLMLALVLLSACAVDASVSSTEQLACTQDPIAGVDTICQERPPPPLEDRTYDAAVAAYGVGAVESKTGVHCTYGPAVSSCSIHVHITENVAVTFTCAAQNSGAGFNCGVDVDS